MLESAKERAYIYDGKEVRLTGRMAKRPMYDRANPNKFLNNITIVEIAPKIGSMVSTDPNLLQWVNPRHLFYVIIEEEVTDELIDTMRAENNDDQTD